MISVSGSARLKGSSSSPGSAGGCAVPPSMMFSSTLVAWATWYCTHRACEDQACAIHTEVCMSARHQLRGDGCHEAYDALAALFIRIGLLVLLDNLVTDVGPLDDGRSDDHLFL